MTDKQIATAYLVNRLNNAIPDHEQLRDVADIDLSEQRCYRIVQRIVTMMDKMRAPLVEYLSRHGIDSH